MLLFTILLAYSQPIAIKGTVKNAAKGKVIPYVNIGIKNKNVGTVAGINGNFYLRLADKNLADSLTFSAVGYQERSFLIKTIIATKENEFILVEKTTALREVVISNKAPKIRKVGTTSRNPLLHGTAQTRHSNDISELAKLIRINAKSAEVLSATIYLQSLKIDSATFRINFYENANGKPSPRIVEQSIIKRLPLNQGWTTTALEQYGIFVDQDFFIGFEYLPDSSHQEKYLFSYGGALGGGTVSRQISLGDWEKVSGATIAAYVTVRQ